MNNINIKLHEYQKQILAKLSNTIALRFNDLILEGLESEHMNYHLKKLVELGLVAKSGDMYELTNSGKDYSNLMDDEIEIIEKQPKTSVLLHVVRKNSKGQVEHLLSKRLRHPYFGKIGRLTGKVRFGEALQEAALRELYEESGLKANFIVLEQVYHKIRHTDKGEFVQDNIFYRFFIKDTFGEFIQKTRHQENLWLTSEDACDEKYDFFDDVELSNRFEPKSFNYIEDIQESRGF